MPPGTATLRAKAPTAPCRTHRHEHVSDVNPQTTHMIPGTLVGKLEREGTPDGEAIQEANSLRASEPQFPYRAATVAAGLPPAHLLITP
jgi:hypothetical protein